MLFYTISEKMRRQIRGMSQGVENTQDGISLCQVADGALAEVNEMLNRMTKLSIQAANGTNSESDRAAIQREINELKVEITRIGKTTKFNDKLVFDSGREIEPTPIPTYSVTSLIKSPAADTGYFTEAFYYNNQYYPSASLDFSGINEDNVKYLYDKSFSFTCGLGCTEDFTFTLINGNGNQNRVEGIPNITPFDRNPHHYYVDIHKMTEGKEIVSAIYQCIKDNPPRKDFTAGPSELNVSHSNAMRKQGDDILIIRTLNDGQATEEAAKKVYPKSPGSTKGMIDCSEFQMEVEELEEDIEFGQNTTSIQTSGEQNDRVDIVIDYMNSGTLGINKLDVTTEKNGKRQIKHAFRTST